MLETTTDRPSRAPTVLLTGASGFVGSHVGVELAARGYRVAPLLRNPAAATRLPFQAATHFAGDLSSEERLREACAGADLVVHAAGLTKARRPRDFDEVNAEGTRRLARAALAAGRPRRLLLVSSLAACGSSRDRPRTEDDPPAPVSAYGRSKLAGERALCEELGDGRLPFTIVRPPIVYGVRDHDVLLVMRSVRTGFLPVAGGRAALRKRYSLVDAEDLARGIVDACLAEAASGRAYFLPGPRDATFAELLEAISAAVGRRAWTPFVPLSVARAAALASETFARLRGAPSVLNRDKLCELAEPGWTCSGGAAARDFGWRPAVDFFAGLARQAAWARGAGLLAFP